MRNIPWSFSSFPKDFQKEVLTKISNVFKKNELVQLVGATGAGTSLIVRLLTQVPKMRDIYFSKKLGYRFLLLDANFLLERNPLTLSRLLLSLFTTSDEIPKDNVGINKRLNDEIEAINRKGRLVLIIDHIQKLNYPELKPFFANLSYIHGIFKSKICFLFVSKTPLTKLEEIENFGNIGRLLTSNIIYVPTLNKKDGFWFIKNIERLVNINLSKKDRENIFEISGGFPRIMKRLVEAVNRGFSVRELAENPRLDNALALHLEELTETEGVADESPILIAYREAGGSSNYRDKFGDVVLKGQLTRNEEKVLKFLTINKGQIVSREEGIEKLWGSGAMDISDHAYDQIIHRLRGKLKGAKPKVDIETIRGRGHFLRTN